MTNAYDRLKSVFQNMEGAMSNTEAFYTILSAAVIADGQAHDAELQEREALVHRTRTLNKMATTNPDELRAVRARVEEKLSKAGGIDETVADAARTIARDAANKDGVMAWSVYAHAADIVFADSKVLQKEMEFLVKLAEALSLPVDQAEAILEFLRRKNAF